METPREQGFIGDAEPVVSVHRGAPEMRSVVAFF